MRCRGCVAEPKLNMFSRLFPNAHRVQRRFSEPGAKWNRKLKRGHHYETRDPINCSTRHAIAGSSQYGGREQ